MKSTIMQFYTPDAAPTEKTEWKIQSPDVLRRGQCFIADEIPKD